MKDVILNDVLNFTVNLDKLRILNNQVPIDIVDVCIYLIDVVNNTCISEVVCLNNNFIAASCRNITI